MLGGNLRWTSIPSRGRPEISAGLMGVWLAQLQLGADFTFDYSDSDLKGLFVIMIIVPLFYKG